MRTARLLRDFPVTSFCLAAFLLLSMFASVRVPRSVARIGLSNLSRYRSGVVSRDMVRHLLWRLGGTLHVCRQTLFSHLDISCQPLE